MTVQEALSRIETGEDMRIERTENGRWFGSVKSDGRTAVMESGATMAETIIKLAEALERKAETIEMQADGADRFIRNVRNSK
ncbi:MAG: hypothetical protein WC565_06565 [Parcubacteria group bacterium]